MESPLAPVEPTVSIFEDFILHSTVTTPSIDDSQTPPILLLTKTITANIHLTPSLLTPPLLDTFPLSLGETEFSCHRHSPSQVQHHFIAEIRTSTAASGRPIRARYDFHLLLTLVDVAVDAPPDAPSTVISLEIIPPDAPFPPDTPYRFQSEVTIRRELEVSALLAQHNWVHYSDTCIYSPDIHDANTPRRTRPRRRSLLSMRPSP